MRPAGRDHLKVQVHYRPDAGDDLWALAGLREAPAETLDGHRVRLSANIGLAEEVPYALAQGAEGIGLLRTEYFFLSHNRPPNEEEQYRFYASISLGVFEKSWAVILGRRAARIISAILRLDWLYQFVAFAYRVLQSVLQTLTTILEGEGGILWVFVLLALLLALIEGGRP